MGRCRGGRVVDELAGGLVRLIASFFHAIFQAVFEAVFRVLFQIVFEALFRIVSAIFRSVVYIVRLSLWKADGLYRALVQRLCDQVRRPALAHALALALLIFGGFMCDASASTLYHRAHPTHYTASLVSGQH
jgi:hypothetical protein